MNIWNHTGYIPVVPHYLTNNWVILPWPIRHLVKTTCSFRFSPQEQGILPTWLLICWCHLSCQRFKIYFIIKGLKTQYRIEKLDKGSLNAYLAVWSTTVFLWIPIWQGIHVKMTCLPIARIIALTFALKIGLADGNRTEQTCRPKTAGDATLLPSLEPSV